MARRVKTDGPVENVNVELLARLELEAFADLFGDYNLKFGRDFDRVHRVAPNL
jgi:hypothetical protein